MRFDDLKSKLVQNFASATANIPPIPAACAAVLLVVFVSFFLDTPSQTVQTPTQPDVTSVDNQLATEGEAVLQPSPELPLKTTDPIAALAADIKLSNSNSYDADEKNWLAVDVKSGDTLLAVFKRAGLPIGTALTVSRQAKKAGFKKGFYRVFLKEKFLFKIEEDMLVKARHIHNRLDSTLLSLNKSGKYQFQAINRKPEIKHQYVEAVINESLLSAAKDANVPTSVLLSMSNIFGWDIDFARDIKKGDRFNILFEQKYIDGEMIGIGDIIAAEFINQDRPFTALRYTTEAGMTSYYTPEGSSMKKRFLRNPVDFARISSRFNLKRKHPVLNRIRAHKGVDYAAATGTPIRAAGDGKVIYRGRKGGYGKAVIIQHSGGIRTLYAHMSNYRSSVKRNTKVKQGQIIGYVGATGLATGPHLHYEFQVNGVHKDPLAMRFKSADPIPQQERTRFAEIASILLTQLRGQNGIQLAKADTQQTETMTQ